MFFFNTNLARGLDSLHEAEENKNPGQKKTDHVLQAYITHIFKAIRLVVTQHKTPETYGLW